MNNLYLRPAKGASLAIISTAGIMARHMQCECQGWASHRVGNLPRRQYPVKALFNKVLGFFHLHYTRPRPVKKVQPGVCRVRWRYAVRLDILQEVGLRVGMSLAVSLPHTDVAVARLLSRCQGVRVGQVEAGAEQMPLSTPHSLPAGY